MKKRQVMYWREPPEDETNTSFVEDLGITCKKIFRKIPNECSYCGKSHIAGIEIYGAGRGVTLWLCEDCEGLLLRYSKSTTEKRLLKASQVYTHPGHWNHSMEDKVDLN
tara:strand:- start:2261 stop:2587 length:327 start_codon:yes stop_codon:yes gene_type:complete